MIHPAAPTDVSAPDPRCAAIVSGPRRRAGRVPLVLAALVAALVAGPLPSNAVGAAPGTVLAQAAEPPVTGSVSRLAGSNRVRTAIAVSRATFDRSDTALLARADEFADALVAAPLALQAGGPVLLTDPDRLSDGVRDELVRLGAGEVLLLGGPAALSEAVADALPAGMTVTRLAGDGREGTAAAVAEAIGPAAGVVLVTGEDFPDAVAAGPLAAGLGWPILLAGDERLPPPTAAALTAQDPDEIVVVGGTAALPDAIVAEAAAAGRAGDPRTTRRLAGAHRYATARAVVAETAGELTEPTTLWLVTGEDFPDALAAGPAVAAGQDALLLLDPQRPDLGDAVALRGTATRVRAVGGPAALPEAALELAAGDLFGPELPPGGRRLFPTYTVVGFYGGPQSPALGVLGEQPPGEVGPRLAAQADGFAEPGRPVLLAFDMITAIATRAPGPDGDYSNPLDEPTVQRYLDAARALGGLLILDIQPGQSDFLTEVQRYERFLIEPDVGVALDPEWRMPPGRVPGQEVGTVDAAEINAVSAYVADLVRRHRLPDKLFVVHNFRVDMVTNRDAVEAPPGLAFTFHMDGFGTRGTKLDSYRILEAFPPFWNGLKLFYDEDVDMFQPPEVLGLDPQPDLVTYQ